MAKKKLTNEELTSLRKALSDFNQAKVKLADIMMEQQQVMGFIRELKQVFIREEEVLLKKYGTDARIDLSTGAVTKKEKEKVNG